MKLKQQSIQKGKYDELGNLVLETEDIKLIQSYFYMFYLNKLHFEKQLKAFEQHIQLQLNNGQYNLKTQNKSSDNGIGIMNPENRAFSLHNLKTEKFAASYREKMRELARYNN